MKEHGELFKAHSDIVKPCEFVLSEAPAGTNEGKTIPNHLLEILYASVDTSLADTWIALGIARREMKQGKDVLLITNPLIDPKF